MGKAMERYHRTGDELFLQLWIDGEPEPLMPVASFFRNQSTMNALELEALERATGSILDVGAGAGSHSLELQARGHSVTAVEMSPAAARVATQRGVRTVICSSVFEVRGATFDTILLLMNGFGIAGDEVGLERLIAHLKSILAPGGRILADSTNLGAWEERFEEELSEGYHGEVTFRVADGDVWDEFRWIYPDEFLLEAICDDLGLMFKVVHYGNDGAFLCEIMDPGLNK